MSSSLSSFLTRVRSTVLQSGTAPKFVLVLGNPSADLDSFISAVVFSYFYSQPRDHKEQRLHVPLLNLPSVPSSDLWRLRPEFGTALRLALHGGEDQELQSFGEEGKEKDKRLLEPLMTISDVQKSSASTLHAAFQSRSSGVGSPEGKPEGQDVVLVDHNAPSIPGLSAQDCKTALRITGCIDHHVDESVVPPSAHPRIIKTGIGSCTSLVVQHLRDEYLWPSPSSDTSNAELAKLALAPILIDTANLTAKGDKISNTDREAVRFLESYLDPLDWDRDAFYHAVSESKSHSLDLLQMDEIFDRDYKEWTESPSSSHEEINIGISSLVRDLPWLIEKAGGISKFVDEAHHFARLGGRSLGIFALISKGNGPNGEFRKEIAVVAYGKVAATALRDFEEKALEKLQLKEWRENGALLKEMEGMVDENGGAYRIWWQGDVSKSRKQVAPLLRDAAKAA